jgi:integrase
VTRRLLIVPVVILVMAETATLGAAQRAPDAHPGSLVTSMNGGIATMASAPGGRLYFAGYFTQLWSPGATTRRRGQIGSLDENGGRLTVLDPASSANDAIADLAVSPDGQTLYAAGYFARIGGRIRPGIAALDSQSGRATAWSPSARILGRAQGGVAVSPDGSTVYVNGVTGVTAQWVAGEAERLKPGTIGQRLDVLKMLLDYAGVEPNPARDSRVKLPKRVTEEANPPSDEHFLAILDALGERWRLFFITIEQGGLRIGEAVALRWADVDVSGLRLRLPRTATKTNTARWVQLPKWLMVAIEDTCPLEDRVPERKVFQGLNSSAGRQAMTRACRDAKIPHYTPHDLRHRRLTLWHQSGVPARELAERAGHSKPSMSLDVYTHVMPVAEVSEERFQAVLV